MNSLLALVFDPDWAGGPVDWPEQVPIVPSPHTGLGTDQVEPLGWARRVASDRRCATYLNEDLDLPGEGVSGQWRKAATSDTWVLMEILVTENVGRLTELLPPAP